MKQVTLKGEHSVLGVTRSYGVCWVELSSVRSSAHPRGSSAAGNCGLRSGVLQARRLVDMRQGVVSSHVQDYLRALG
jgi:hypothetical protein